MMCFCCRATTVLEVYKYSPAGFSAGDIPVDEVVMRLKTRQWPAGRPNPESNSLYALLDESAHQVVEKYAALRAKVPDPYSNSRDKEFTAISDATGMEAILLKNFNRIIAGPCIFDKKGFGDVELAPQTKKRLKQKPQGDDLIRLNWLLLEDAEFAGSRGAIVADGETTGTFKHTDHIEHVVIFPEKLTTAELQDICVIFSPTNRIALADLTEDKIKSYAVDNSSFHFNVSKLVEFESGRYYWDHPEINKGNVVCLCSLKNNRSLVLPCSVEDFEKVFGKADEVERIFEW